MSDQENATAPLQDHIEQILVNFIMQYNQRLKISNKTNVAAQERARTQLTELVHHRERIARNDELNRLLKPRDCLRPWCKVEHTHLTKLHVKARLTELNKEEHEPR